MKHQIIAATICLLAACGGGTEPSAVDSPGADTATTAGVTAIDLSAQGLPLLLSPPEKQLTGGVDPSIVWKDETGTFEVRAGDHFGLMIREEPVDFPRLKAALDRDLLKKNTILSETPELLVYKSEFPDDPSLVFIHFCQVVNAGDRTFVIQDIDGQTFNQQDIERMATAVSPKPRA